MNKLLEKMQLTRQKSIIVKFLNKMTITEHRFKQKSERMRK